MELYKIVVRPAVDVADAVARLGEAAGLTEETGAVRGVEVQRIDRTERATVIFATTSREGAAGVAKAFEQAEAKVSVDQADRDELLSDKPAAD